MSQVCTACNGKGGLRGGEGIIDISANTQTFQGDQPAPALCTQCGGRGYQ